MAPFIQGGGAVKFREKLLIFSLETYYKYKFVQNEKVRVIVKCIQNEEKDCKWRIHVSHRLRMDDFL